MTLRTIPTPAISERDWQAQVVELAHKLGWKHMHVRTSRGKGGRHTTATNVDGWPDLFLWNERQQRTIFAELKSAKGVVSDDQRAVLRSLLLAGQEVHIWRPDDLEYVMACLRVPPGLRVLCDDEADETTLSKERS